MPLIENEKGETARPRLFYMLRNLGRIPKHREEVTDGSGEDEQVPGEVGVTNAMGGKENYAEGVCDAAGEYPRNTG